MKKTTNSNMYAAAANFVWQSFETHLSGNEMGLWCIVSKKPLNETARKALSSSAKALGFGEAACTFVTLQPAEKATEAQACAGADADANSATISTNIAFASNASVAASLPAGISADTDDASVSDPNAEIDAGNLFRIVEGIDPLCVVATDTAAINVLSSAYRQNVPPDAHCRLFGRDMVAFSLFEGMLEEAGSKQKAWALLKKLPRLN